MAASHDMAYAEAVAAAAPIAREPAPHRQARAPAPPPLRRPKPALQLVPVSPRAYSSNLSNGDTPASASAAGGRDGPYARAEDDRPRRVSRLDARRVRL